MEVLATVIKNNLVTNILNGVIIFAMLVIVILITATVLANKK